MEIRIYERPVDKNIRNSIGRICLVFLSLLVSVGYMEIPGTNSFFSDKADVSGASFSAGVWIPEISMTIVYEGKKEHRHQKDKKKNKDEKKKYEKNPCVELSSSIEDSTIYYEFSADGDPVEGGMEYDGKCIEIPKDETDFQAQAVNDENENWKSEVIEEKFEVKKKEKKDEDDEDDDEDNDDDDGNGKDDDESGCKDGGSESIAKIDEKISADNELSIIISETEKPEENKEGSSAEKTVGKTSDTDMDNSDSSDSEKESGSEEEGDGAEEESDATDNDEEEEPVEKIPDESDMVSSE